MKETTVTCDNCEADISQVESGYDVYRIKVEPELIHNTSSMRYAVLREAPLQGREHNFCGLKCLRAFLGVA